NGHLASECRGVSLPSGDLTLARLAGGGGGVQSLANGLEDGFDIQAQQGADAGGSRWAQVRYVVDLVLVQADGLDQVHLDFVAGGDAADQVLARSTGVLCNSQDWWDVIAWVGVLGGQEGVVVVQLAHGYAVGPSRPFRGDLLGDAEDAGTLAAGGWGVGQGLGAGSNDRAAVQRRDGHRSVVDDAVDDHVGHFCGDLYRIGCNRGDLVRQLVFASQVF